MRAGSRLVLAVTAATVATLVSVIPASAAAGPGAPGIGDPYYPTMGNGGYDVAHYNIELSYEPVSDRLSGTTTIVALTTQDLTAFNLDFLLNVSSVRVNYANLPFSQSQVDGELTVRLPGVARRHTLLVIEVTYADVPSTVVSKQAWIQGWRRTPDGAVSVGEPYQAEWWYPSNNHPGDKATYSVSVAVPSGVEVLSNGVLDGTTTEADGKVRWHWRSSKPQITYATLLAIGQFQIESSTTSRRLPMINAYSELIPADRLPFLRREIERTPDIIDFLSSRLGPYPFEATGAVIGVPGTDGRVYGIETQTRAVISWDFVKHDEGTNTVAHELAHQWFGDSVALSRWRDLWLNEGLATYGEFLWIEHLGERTVQQNIDSWYNRYPATDPFWQARPGEPGPGGPGKQFHLAVYYRGAMAVHALRKAVGDDHFFTILRSWPRDNRHGNATSADFFALAEKISGKQLDDVFTTWLYTPGKPAVAP